MPQKPHDGQPVTVLVGLVGYASANTLHVGASSPQGQSIGQFLFQMGGKAEDKRLKPFALGDDGAKLVLYRLLDHVGRDARGRGERDPFLVVLPARIPTDQAAEDRRLGPAGCQNVIALGSGQPLSVEVLLNTLEVVKLPVADAGFLELLVQRDDLPE